MGNLKRLTFFTFAATPAVNNSLRTATRPTSLWSLAFRLTLRAAPPATSATDPLKKTATLLTKFRFAAAKRLEANKRAGMRRELKRRSKAWL